MAVEAISGFGGYNQMNMYQLFNDPYFLQAYGAPNINQMVQYQQQTPQVYAPQAAQSVAANPSFQGAEAAPAEKEKKGKGKAWLLLGGAALLAGSAWMITRGKTAGAEGLWEQFKVGFKTLWKNKADKVISFTEKNGAKICQVTGEKNIIKNSANVADDLAKIGLKDGAKLNIKDVIKTNDNGTAELLNNVKINKGSFNFNGATIDFEGDKIVRYVDDKGKDILSRYLNPEAVAKYAEKNKADKELIDDFVAKFLRGQDLNKINNLEVEHSIENVVRTFTRENPNSNFVFQQAVTDRFNINDSIIADLASKNAKLKDALEKIKSGEKGLGQIASAQRVTNIGTFTIVDGKIVSLTNISGKTIPAESDMFKNLNERYVDLFEEVLQEKDKFINVVRKVYI